MSIVPEFVGRMTPILDKLALSWELLFIADPCTDRIIAEVEIPPNTGDFRLMSRRVIVEIKRLKESHGFLRGMVAAVGFRQTAVLFERSPRFSGRGNYNRFLGSLKIGLNGIICFSN